MGTFLRHLRTRAGLDVDAAAERLGVARATVYAWEAGDKEPGKENLSALMDLYAATADERVQAAVYRAYGVEPTVIGA